MIKFKRKQLDDFKAQINDKRTYHGAMAMLSIAFVIFVISILAVSYSKQIQKQFFQERSKNLMNISSKMGDMMNSMITDVWSCLDTLEYQAKKKNISFLAQ